MTSIASAKDSLNLSIIFPKFEWLSNASVRTTTRLPWVDVFNAVTKPYVNEAEAIYHAFPLGNKKQPTVYLDTPGAVLRPGIDQIPGTATDWHGIQHYFAVNDDNYTTVVASPEIRPMGTRTASMAERSCREKVRA